MNAPTMLYVSAARRTHFPLFLMKVFETLHPGEPPLKLDSGPPKLPVKEYMKQEARFRITENLDVDRYHQLLQWAQRDAERRYAVYEQLSKMTIPQVADIPDTSAPPQDQP